MKKNLLAILILAILVVNTAMTGFMMLTVMTTNSQAIQLITDVASALQIEANGGVNGQGFSNAATGNVRVDNIATYEIADLTINLKPSVVTGPNGETSSKTHYMMASVVLSMDMSNADYENYGTAASMDTMKSLLTATIQDTISAHTLEEIQSNEDALRKEILGNIQSLYGSNFIYSISFSNKVFS
ncbi:MAG: flagellar basal body-associated FliL family protein [Butyrivibrio sp.]|nr:flagellar basal body-associated FliL family protein [Butyrivibrio sp.]